jgi:hypothetical protein
MKKESYELLSKVVKEVLKNKPKRIKMKGKNTPVKQYRVSLQISGREAAKRVGMSYRNWNRVENKEINKVPLYVLIMLKQGVLLEPINENLLYSWWEMYHD